MALSDIQIIDTLHGRFSVDMARDKKIGARLKSGTYHQEETLSLLKKFITPTSVVVDIGAHIGTEAVPLARVTGTVIAFEPAPEAYALLVKNIEQNGVVVDTRNKGLSSSRGSASIETISSSNAGANTLVFGEGSVEVSTLDEEVSHADIIKIDVEGMELAVFEGGKNLIINSKPVILSEINISALRAHHSSPQKIEHFLKEAGYDLYLPLQNKNGDMVLGAIGNLTAIAACTAPRAWALGGSSAPFDILALPQGKELPLATVSFFATLSDSIVNNLKRKVQRFI